MGSSPYLLAFSTIPTLSRCSVKVYEINKCLSDPVVPRRDTEKGKKVVSIAGNIIEMGKQVNPT